MNITNKRGTPGKFRIVYTLLICNNIPIIASYLGEPSKDQIVNTFIEVTEDKVKLARKIIDEFQIEDSEERLCINVANCPPQRLALVKFASISDDR